MGFVEGESLADKIKDGPLPPRVAAEYLRKIAEAMAFAHEKGVIHRDLKPANVLVDINNEPKVTDFGLAKKVEGDSGLTATGQILGTPSYMPPEQASGKVDEVTESADVYSLGAILYALVTGRPPFQAASHLDTLLQVIDQEPVSPRKLNPQVPQDLETICLKCLQKDLRHRYESSQELVDELQRYLNGEPIKARPIKTAERVWRWARRKPGLAGFYGMSAVLILLVAIGGPLVAVAQRQLRLESESRRRQAEDATREAILREAEAVRKSRESGYRTQVWERLKSIVNTDISKQQKDRIRQQAVKCLGDFAGLEPVTIEGDFLGQSKIHATFFDDDSIAVASPRGNISIRDATTGKELERFRYGNPIQHLESSQDGKAIFVSDSKNLECWIRASEDQWIKGWECPFARSTTQFVLIEDAGKLALVDGDDIVLVSMEDGKPETRIPTEESMTGVDSIAVSPDGQLLVAAGGLPIKVVVWRVEDLMVLHDFAPPTSGLSKVEFSPDGEFMVLGSDEGFITYRTKEFSQWSLSRTNTITSVCFSPNSRYLLFPTVTGSIQLWNMATQQLAVELRHPRPNRQGIVCFSPSGNRFMSAGGGAISIWRMGLPEKKLLAAHSQGTTCVAFHPRKSILASGSKDGTLAFWDAVSGEEIDRITTGAPIQTIGFSADGTLIAAGTWNPKRGIHIWQTDTTHSLPIFISGPSRRGVNGVRFSKDGRYLAMTGDGGTLLLELKKSDAARQISISQQAFLPYGGKHLQFDSESKYLVTVGTNLKVWEVDQILTGNPRLDPRVLSGKLLSPWKNLEFHPTRSWAYVVSGDGVIEARALKRPMVRSLPESQVIVQYSPTIWRSNKSPNTWPLTPVHML